MASEPGSGEDSAVPGCLGLVAFVVVVLYAAGWDGGAFDWIGDHLAAFGRSDTPPPKDAGWIDRLFGADAFVGLVRLFLGATALYFVAAFIHNAARKLYPDTFGMVARSGSDSRRAEARASELEKELEELRDERDDYRDLVDRVWDARVADAEPLPLDFDDPASS